MDNELTRTEWLLLLRAKDGLLKAAYQAELDGIDPSERDRIFQELFEAGLILHVVSPPARGDDVNKTVVSRFDISFEGIQLLQRLSKENQWQE